ncbi:MAG: dihydropteroate synthase [Lentisphaerae bacterium]|nr:dihydropteroate synthase [Lentisphaerota bacterium]
MSPADSAKVWQCRQRVLRLAERPLIMGILNVTPDSFSDGGRYFRRDEAVARGLQMVQEGADIIDVGGESTRPGAEEVAVADELERVIPVIEALSRREDIVLSIDTMKSAVAERALQGGAHIINDVSALSADERMAAVAREFGAGVILMHKRGQPRTMQVDPVYADVVAEVRDYLGQRLDYAREQGLAARTLAIDPGIGFGKTCAHNVALLANLSALRAYGRPIVVGLSRKAFIGQLTGCAVAERLAGTLGALAFCLGEGAQVLRVHDVKAARDVGQVVSALLSAQIRKYYDK